MRPGEWFKEKLESLKDDFEFRLETLILDLTEKICARMKQREINRTRLSELLNVSPPAVSKILNGNSNFTLRTLLSLSEALGLDLRIDFVEKSSVYCATYSCQLDDSDLRLDWRNYSTVATTLATTSGEIQILAKPLKPSNIIRFPVPANAADSEVSTGRDKAELRDAA